MCATKTTKSFTLSIANCSPGPFTAASIGRAASITCSSTPGSTCLSAMFQERFGRPTVSFHLGAELSSIDLRGAEPTLEILEGAERAANRIIFEDRPINVRYGTQEQLAEMGVRKEVDRTGILRAIEIEGADLQPCGGTHVRRTAQIGMLLVRRCTKMRQDWRVEFVCGARSERLARNDFRLIVRAAAESRVCARRPGRRCSSRRSERDANFKELRSLLQRLAESEAASALQSRRNWRIWPSARRSSVRRKYPSRFSRFLLDPTCEDGRRDRARWAEGQWSVDFLAAPVSRQRHERAARSARSNSFPAKAAAIAISRAGNSTTVRKSIELSNLRSEACKSNRKPAPAKPPRRIASIRKTELRRRCGIDLQIEQRQKVDRAKLPIDRRRPAKPRRNIEISAKQSGGSGNAARRLLSPARHRFASFGNVRRLSEPNISRATLQTAPLLLLILRSNRAAPDHVSRVAKRRVRRDPFPQHRQRRRVPIVAVNARPSSSSNSPRIASNGAKSKSCSL